ncbi:MAG: SIMPL domain-containing protein [Pirellulales bacterium]|nr:SIMPL domain-containing protein [Pirellulales bacterium]
MRLAMCSPRCNTNSASASQGTWLAMVFLLALASRQPLVSADDGNAGITVTGWGEAMTRPTSLELHVKVTGTGTLGTDALTRFEQSRREMTEIVAAMQPQLVKLHAGGIAITPGGDPDMYWQTLAPGGEAGLSELAVGSVCRITMGGLTVLSEQHMVELTSHLMDTLRERGVALLPAQQAQALEAGAANDVYAARALVRFVVEDLSAAQAEARRMAFLTAKASAEALAKLAGMRLGPVVAVQEISRRIDREMRTARRPARPPLAKGMRRCQPQG